MNKASSALLATAGVTVGLLGFALPAGAATTPTPGQQVQSRPNQPAGFQQGTPGSNNQRDGKNGGGKGGNGGYNPDPIKTGKPGSKPCHGKPQPKPCHSKTPPKPCYPVVKPCRDKHGHVISYGQAKHTYVCHPKPCKQTPKPCHPKCKKTQPHKHPCPQKHRGNN